MWNRQDEPQFHAAARRDEAIVIMAPLLSGVMTGRWDLSNADEFRTKYAGHWWFKEHDMDKTLQAMDCMRKRFGDSQQGFLSAILRYCLGLPGVVSVLPGFSTLEQVESLAAAVDAPPLSAEEMAFIRETLREDLTLLKR